MEQAESKECPKAEQGEFHDAHSWIDQEGLHACPGLEDMTADEVMARMGLHRRVDAAMDEVKLTNLLHGEGQNGLVNRTDLKKLFAEGRIDEKLYDSPLNYDPLVVEGARQAPAFSENDPLFSDSYRAMQQRLYEQGDQLKADILWGPRTEFAVRTHDWTIEDFRKELYKKEQEVVELKELLYKVGERLVKIANKMLRRAGD